MRRALLSFAERIVASWCTALVCAFSHSRKPRRIWCAKPHFPSWFFGLINTPEHPPPKSRPAHSVTYRAYHIYIHTQNHTSSGSNKQRRGAHLQHSPQLQQLSSSSHAHTHTHITRLLRPAPLLYYRYLDTQPQKPTHTQTHTTRADDCTHTHTHKIHPPTHTTPIIIIIVTPHRINHGRMQQQ